MTTTTRGLDKLCKLCLSLRHLRLGPARNDGRTCPSGAGISRAACTWPRRRVDLSLAKLLLLLLLAASPASKSNQNKTKQSNAKQIKTKRSARDGPKRVAICRRFRRVAFRGRNGNFKAQYPAGRQLIWPFASLANCHGAG